ncbi:hypothetical protein ACJMK2_034992 [Sinanodonta woodiana]|uniref:Endonuclease/exonuclease/phosphatase domain-containing protein n=1 Tax=Sinanodonta woodiana TaxID=1069815 RepID=A0ABD3WTI4_SINWO
MKTSGSTAVWICPHCGTPQLSTSILSPDSSIELSNSFTLLDNLDTSNDHVQQANKTPPKAITTSLKIMSINANSLVSDNKHAALCAILKNHNPDILTVCETRLDNTISDSAVLPQDSGYEIVVRKDNKQGAGGVLIAVRNTLLASPINDLNTNCEIAWIRVEVKGRKPL